MRIPKRLQPLIEEGLIDEVVRPITAGKEAEVFVVWASGHLRAAKVYKEANERSFKNRADYLDGRKARGSRDERALKRGGKFAKDQEEEGWQTAELMALGKLRAAGVRVPEPRGFMEGVLLMDLVLTLEGEPAPRLADCEFTADEARDLFGGLVHEVQRMLCAGIVHGDLSEYNVLLAPYGPVIIDFPQMVDAAASRGARRLLLRDLGNLRTFAARFAPELARTRYAEEMWSLYERAVLTPDTVLTGQWKDSTRVANIEGVREAISDAEKDHARQAAREPRKPGGPGGRGKGGPGPRNAPGPRPANTGNPQGPRPANTGNPQGPRPANTGNPHGPRPANNPHPQGPRPANNPHPQGPRPANTGHPQGPRPADAGHAPRPRPPAGARVTRPSGEHRTAAPARAPRPGAAKGPHHHPQSEPAANRGPRR